MACCLESALLLMLLLLLLLLADAVPSRTAPSPPGITGRGYFLRCGVENGHWSVSQEEALRMACHQVPVGIHIWKPGLNVLFSTQYLPFRVCELHGREPLRGRGRGVHSRRAVPAAALRVRGPMPGPPGAGGPERPGGLRAFPLPPCPAPLLRPRAPGAHAGAALLPVREPRVRRAPAPDLRPGLRVRGPRAGAALLPEGPGPLRARPPVQASCAPAPGSRASCPEERGPRCLLAYAGLIGTAVTPNYLDNVSARVAPWCGCGDSGNRLEECEAFRQLFTRNPCLDGAMQAFNTLWPSILQDGPNPYQNTGHHCPQVSLLSILTALALQALL